MYLCVSYPCYYREEEENYCFEAVNTALSLPRFPAGDTSSGFDRQRGEGAEKSTQGTAGERRRNDDAQISNLAWTCITLYAEGRNLIKQENTDTHTVQMPAV